MARRAWLRCLAQCCPLVFLSACRQVVMISPSGASLAKIAGVVPGSELRAALQQAFTAFRQQQQQQQLAAQATLLAMAAAAAAQPAPPAAGPAPAAAAAPDQAADLLDLLPAPSAPAEQAPSAPQPQPEALADPATIPYRLRFKFMDGTSIEADFTAASLLAEVFAAIDEARAAGGRPTLPYVLVQAAPRLMAGAAEEGRALGELGIQPRTSLQVVPQGNGGGHRPPSPPEPEPEVVERQAAEPAPHEAAAAAAAAAREAAGPAATAASAKAKAAPVVAAAAAPVPPSPPLTEVQLLVRLSNGHSLRQVFPPTATLAAVYDWIDSARTDRCAFAFVQLLQERRTCSYLLL
jgi:hypothetical protein